MSKADDYLRMKEAIERRVGNTGLLAFDNSNDILKIGANGAGGVAHIILRHLQAVLLERQPELLAQALEAARLDAVTDLEREQERARSTLEKLNRKASA